MTNIVMLVCNRYNLTRQAIESLLASGCNDYTLTVVDDGSSFKTENYLLNKLTGPNHALIRVPQSSHRLGQLKNLGVYWSRQVFGNPEWLYISDNDVFFTYKWLDDLIRVAELSEADGFRIWGGQAHPYHQPTDTWLDITGQLRLTQHDCLAGVSMLMRFKSWDHWGPFVRDSAPGVCQSEDYALTQLITGDQGKVGVIYPPVVTHTGITNSEGRSAIGSELFPRVAGVVYE